MARRLPGAKIVKAFNTLYYKFLEENDAKTDEERIAILESGDDGPAKDMVADLISQLGFVAIDLGTLREGGRLQQPDSPLFNQRLPESHMREALRAAL